MLYIYLDSLRPSLWCASVAVVMTGVPVWAWASLMLSAPRSTGPGCLPLFEYSQRFFKSLSRKKNRATKWDPDGMRSMDLFNGNVRHLDNSVRQSCSAKSVGEKWRMLNAESMHAHIYMKEHVRLFFLKLQACSRSLGRSASGPICRLQRGELTSRVRAACCVLLHEYMAVWAYLPQR